jgi:hypothetical protein
VFLVRTSCFVLLSERHNYWQPYRTVDNYAEICGLVIKSSNSLNTAVEDNKFQDERQWRYAEFNIAVLRILSYYNLLDVALFSSASVERHAVCCFTFTCNCRAGLMFVALLACASVEGAYCLLFYLHVQVSRGHTVCCFTFMCKCRGGILFVALPPYASVEGAYCLLLWSINFFKLSPMWMKDAVIDTAGQQ